MIIDTEKMKVYDISMPVKNDMPVYGGKEGKRPRILKEPEFSKGHVYESRIEMNLHTGTHVDSPLHMIPGEAPMEKYKPEQFITGCYLIDLTDVIEKITADDLKGRRIRKGDFLLLKTQNSFKDILEGAFIYLDKTGAAYLNEIGIAGVGIDALGIERAQPEHETHIQLFGKGVVILEGLRLRDVEEGEYLLCAAPVLIPGTEAAPARAFLIR
jgi:arylformamidase